MSHDCPFCENMFGTRRGLEVHAGRVHDRKLTQFECDQCGQMFDASPSTRSEEHTFCDVVCASKWKSEHQRGTKHPAWTGGSNLYRALLTLGEKSFSSLRQQVRREADGCQMCGEDDALEVHHVVPLYAGGSNFRANLVALCRSCHNHAEAHFRNEIQSSALASPR